HIFVRLGLWQDSIASNIAANASGAHAAEMHLAESHYHTHAMDLRVRFGGVHFSGVRAGSVCTIKRMPCISSAIPTCRAVRKPKRAKSSSTLIMWLEQTKKVKPSIAPISPRALRWNCTAGRKRLHCRFRQLAKIGWTPFIGRARSARPAAV